MADTDIILAETQNRDLGPQDRNPGKYAHIPDAILAGPHQNLDPETRSDLDAYISKVNQWRSRDPEFLNDAFAVDENLKERQQLMMRLSTKAVLDHDDLHRIRAYVHADKASIAKPDPGEEAYENFRLRRAQLRDRLGLKTFRISKDEYADVTQKIQGDITREENIEHQRDLIGIRKEVAQENAQNPRFVAELAADKSQLFDELLVDLDRTDLKDDQNAAWLASARTRAEMFSEELGAHEKLAGSEHNVAQKTQAYMRMVEVGKQVTPNPMAVKNFVDIEIEKVRQAEIKSLQKMRLSPEVIEGLNPQGRIGSKTYELGIAAMENPKFTKEQTLSFFESIDMGNYLDSNDQYLMRPTEQDTGLNPQMAMLKRVAQDPVEMFMVANKAFNKQFDEGNANAALSFAVMEHQAQLIMNDPALVQKLAKRDLDAAQTVDQFNPTIRAQIARAESGESFEDKLFNRLAETNALNTETVVNLKGDFFYKDEKTERTVSGNLEDVLNPKHGQFHARADGNGGLILAASQEDFEKGNTFAVDAPISYSTDEEGNEVAQTLWLSSKGDTKPLSNTIRASFDDAGNMRLDMGEDRSIGIQKDAIKASNPDLHTPQEALKAKGPHVEVLHGGFLRLSASAEDAEAGRGATLSLYGINVPGPNTKTTDEKFNAGDAAKEHIEYLFKRYGRQGGMTFDTIDGRDGNKELFVKLPNGENLSHRLLHDGYALPSDCEHQRHNRETQASTAANNDRGLWKHGFPDDDGTWRGESLMPHLTSRDKKERLAQNVGKAMASTPLEVSRILSDRSTKIMSMKIGAEWDSANFVREAMMAVKNNPDRVMKIYNENLSIMKDLRKKIDKDGKGLTNKERAAHDQLTYGSRLLGYALVQSGEQVDPQTGKKTWKYLSPFQYRKDTDPLLSQRGLAIPESVKKFAKELGETTEALGHYAVQKSRKGLDDLLGAADSLTR